MRTVFLILVCSAFALADEVKIKNGGRIVGRVTYEDDDRVTVETGFGEVTLHRDMVESIDTAHDAPIKEYYRRWEKLRESKRAEDYCEMARWCEANGCIKFVRILREKRDTLEPNHQCAATATVVQSTTIPTAKPKAPDPEPEPPPRKQPSPRPKEKVWVAHETILVGITPASRRPKAHVSNPTTRGPAWGTRSQFPNIPGFPIPTTRGPAWGAPSQFPNIPGLPIPTTRGPTWGAPVAVPGHS